MYGFSFDLLNGNNPLVKNVCIYNQTIVFTHQGQFFYVKKPVETLPFAEKKHQFMKVGRFVL